MSWHVAAVLEEAARYLGVRELGTNRGREVDYWNYEAIRDWRQFPMGGKGAPWCAAFVSACGVQGIGRKLWPVPHTAIADLIAQWGEEHDVAYREPEPGDIFCLHYPAKGRYGHVGFVVGVPSGSFETIEGNTNPGGSREGYGVFKRVRTVTDRCLFVRWAAVI